MNCGPCCKRCCRVVPSGWSVSGNRDWEDLGQELAFGFLVQKGKSQQEIDLSKYVIIMKENGLAEGESCQSPNTKTRGQTLPEV